MDGEISMAAPVRRGARLDRLADRFVPLSDLLAGRGRDVLRRLVTSMWPAACSPQRFQTKFSTPLQIPQFISLTFVGMTIGSLVTGFLGDAFGRRFTYQVNLRGSASRRSRPPWRRT